MHSSCPAPAEPPSNHPYSRSRAMQFLLPRPKLRSLRVFFNSARARWSPPISAIGRLDRPICRRATRPAEAASPPLSALFIIAFCQGWAQPFASPGRAGPTRRQFSTGAAAESPSRFTAALAALISGTRAIYVPPRTREGRARRDTRKEAIPMRNLFAARSGRGERPGFIAY